MVVKYKMHHSSTTMYLAPSERIANYIDRHINSSRAFNDADIDPEFTLVASEVQMIEHSEYSETYIASAHPPGWYNTSETSSRVDRVTRVVGQTPMFALREEDNKRYYEGFDKWTEKNKSCFKLTGESE